MIKSVKLQEKTNRGSRCKNCAHYCLLSEGESGKCGVRKNEGGDLKVLNYGKLIALNLDPIEKKPLHHFLPGTETLSLAAPGCCFRCKNCQNWRISQQNLEDTKVNHLSPEKIIQLAKRKKVPSISYTYGEPINYSEYALDVMKMAHSEGLKNIWVTNGYFSDELMNAIASSIDALNIDLKSFSEDFYRNICGGKLSPVLEAIKKMKESAWIEITTLIIPGLNDDPENLEKIADFIAGLDRDIPWHLSAFSAALSKDMKDRSDSTEKDLEKAYLIGKNAGINHIYLGNVFTSEKENTFCPQCGQVLIIRNGYVIERLDHRGTCKNCGEKISLILE